MGSSAARHPVAAERPARRYPGARPADPADQVVGVGVQVDQVDRRVVAQPIPREIGRGGMATVFLAQVSGVGAQIGQQFFASRRRP